MPEDELGNGYEYLIKQFADDSGHTAQEFYTNRTLVHLMAQMLEPKAGETHLRPDLRHRRHAHLVPGRGEAQRRRHPHHRPLRAGAHQHHRGHRPHEPRAARRVGLRHRAAATRCSEPAFIEGDRLQDLRRGPRQSAVLDQEVEPRGVAERPMGPQLPRHAAAGPRRLRLLPAHPEEHGPEDRPLRDPLSARRALPQRRSRDAAQADRDGPGRVRARPGPEPLLQLADGSVRRRSAAPQKPPSGRGKILFIDAVHEVARERAQSFLKPEHQERDPRRRTRRSPTSPASPRSSTIEEVLAKDGNLSIPRYVQTGRSGVSRWQRRRRLCRGVGCVRGERPRVLDSRWTRSWRCSTASSPRRPAMPEARQEDGWTHGRVRRCRAAVKDTVERSRGRWLRALRRPRAPRPRRPRRSGAGATSPTARPSRSVFRPGQVLFGKRRAYQRKVAVADFERRLLGDIYVLRAEGRTCCCRSCCRSSARPTRSSSTRSSTSAGSLSPRTNWKSLAKYEFALPPLEEQRRIAELLQAAEERLKQLCRSLRRLSSMRTVDASRDRLIDRSASRRALLASSASMLLPSRMHRYADRTSALRRRTGCPVLGKRHHELADRLRLSRRCSTRSQRLRQRSP